MGGGLKESLSMCNGQALVHWRFCALRFMRLVRVLRVHLMVSVSGLSSPSGLSNLPGAAGASSELPAESAAGLSRPNRTLALRLGAEDASNELPARPLPRAPPRRYKMRACLPRPP